MASGKKYSLLFMIKEYFKKENKMIRYVEGDIFHSPAQVLVNPVNTVGVMGKGIALSFKNCMKGKNTW